MESYTIDATNRSLGRTASEAAALLMGKNRTDMARHKVPDVSVTIENASRIKLTQKKAKDTVHIRYSGHPGGQKSETLSEIIDKKGYGAAFEKAIYGMLPANKLRSVMMKRLTIKD
jgi:large subunit ribosomal protein L13